MPFLVTFSRHVLGVIALAAFLAAPVAAQHIITGLSAVGGVPHDEFHDGQSRVGFGASALVLYGVGPVAVGLELGGLTYDRRAAPLRPAVDAQAGYFGDVTTVSRIGHLHGVLRLQLPEGPVRPYVDGLVGFQRFMATTHFEQHVVVGGGSLLFPAAASTVRTTSLDSDDFALSYGGGGGVLFRVASGVEGGMPFEAFLDIGARYLRGEEATYRAVNVRRDGTTVVEFVRTRTDMIRPHIGIVVQLRR